jgi:LacI family transcriptional regulator
VPPLGVKTRQSSDISGIEDPDVASAVTFIRERACLGVSVEEVVKHVVISRSQLERRFRKYLGRSPQAEIRRVQLRRVMQLLAETDLTLESIANLTGFQHPEYMSVIFKRLTGQTPRDYRLETLVHHPKPTS